MAVNTASNFQLQSIQQQNQSLTSFFFPLDHISHFPDFDSFFYQRGPRYEAYADLRESKLRAKRIHSQIQSIPEEDVEERSSVLTPKRAVKFQRNLRALPKRAKGSSVLAQSVPDFSAVMRKENRKPSSPLPPMATPPPTGSKNGRGSKSVNSGEKSVMARKSYASIQELKGGAIYGENKGGLATRNALRQSRNF